MRITERTIADMKKKGTADRMAENARVDLFPGQRVRVMPSTLDASKFAVVLIDGEVMDDTALNITFRGGRGEQRPDENFRAGMGERKRRNCRGNGTHQGMFR